MTPQAVEVTKLSLLLKVLEGESEESIGKQLSLFRERALPDLTCNIKCGNSLIGPDIYSTQSAPQVTLPGFDLEEQYRINAFDWKKEFPHVFDRPARSLWLVTFVTHNSRVSERMVTYGVKSGDPLILDATDRLQIAQYISECCHSHHIPVVAWDVLPDHVHMILAAEDERELDEQIRKIKGFSSYSFQRARGWDEGGHVWAQKYHHLLVTDQRMLDNTYSYVMDNHIKHDDQWGQELVESFGAHLPPQPIISTSSVSSLSSSLTVPSPPTIGSPSPTRGLSPLLTSSPTSPRSISSDSSLSPPSLMDVRDELCVTPEVACQPSSGGFDAVIGNPPYVKPHNIPVNIKKMLWASFSTFVAKSDLYSCFMEKGLSLTKPSGLFCYIVPQTWTSLESFTKIREYIINNSKVCKLTKLPHKVFATATVETCIFLLQKNISCNDDNEVIIENLNFRGTINPIRKFPQKSIRDAYLYNFQLYGLDESQSIIDKIKKNGRPLDQFVNFSYGFKTADDKKFIHTTKMYDASKPFIRSAVIKRYWFEAPSEYVWYVPEIMIKNRKTARPGESARFEAEKLIVARMGKALAAVYDQGGLYVKDAMILQNKYPEYSLKYLLGIINSRLMNYYYNKFFVTIDVLKNALLSLNVRPINFSNKNDVGTYNRLVTLVEIMLNLHEQLYITLIPTDKSFLLRQIDTTDHQIDALVYELYGLTDEEIRVVEGK